MQRDAYFDPVEEHMRTTSMNLRARYRQWVSYFETVSVLRQSSDRTLDDLGIDRRDIKAVARRKTLDI